MRASLDLQTSRPHASWILHRMIHCMNVVTVNIQQHNNPDALVIPKAGCVEKWRGQGNCFDDIVIQGDRAPWLNAWELQQRYRPAKLLYTSHCSNIINALEANSNGSVLWWTLHHDWLLGEDLEYLSSAMPNRTHGMIICQDALQIGWCIVDVSPVLTPMQLVPSGEDNQYLLNPDASLESYNVIW